MTELTTPETSTAAEGKVQTLTATALMKRYGTRKVVRNVSLSVKSGEVVGLLGPNGAGKTTTFYMVVGLVPPNGGSIHLNGMDITHLPIFRRARLGVSYLPQEASVFRRLSVEDNIRSVLELQTDEKGKPLTKAEVEKRLNALLEELQIEHIRTNMAVSLSGARGAARKLPGRLQTTRALFCSMNPLRALIPLPSLKFSASCGF